MVRQRNSGSEGTDSRFQFTLRTLIFLSFGVATILAFVGNSLNRLQRCHAIVARIHRIGGRIDYDDPFYVRLHMRRGYSAHEVIWLALGADPLAHATTVVFDGQVPISPNELDLIRRFPRLATLALAGLTVSDRHMRIAGSAGGLQRLLLTDTHVTAAGIAELGGLTRLRSLSLAGATVTNETLTGLHFLTHLRHLNLINTKVTSAGIPQIAELVQLKTLSIRCAPAVDDTALDHLGKIKQLEWLELSDTAVTDDGLAKLRCLQNLTMLDLSGTRISNEGLVHLRGLSHLIDLRLSATRIDDAGLTTVGQLKGLQALRLGKTLISNAGLRDIVALRELQLLDLWPTDISASGLRYLARLPRLVSLSVGPLVSVNAAEQLQRDLPGCQISLIDSNGTILIEYPGRARPIARMGHRPPAATR